MFVIGVDPGVSGALVALTDRGEFIEGWPLPILGPPKQRRLDAAVLHRTLTSMMPVCIPVMEQPRAAHHDEYLGRSPLGQRVETEFRAFIEELVSMPGRGAIGAQSSGILFGAVLAVLQIANASIQPVRSMKWQKTIDGLPSRPSTKDLEGKERARVLAVHRKHFKAALTSKARMACPELAREMDKLGAKGEGLADAYWIARFGLRQSAELVLS